MALQGGYESSGRPVRVAEGLRPDNDPSAPRVSPSTVACGGSHTGTVSRRGDIFTWGIASRGELGHGGQNDCAVPAPRSVTLPSRKRLRVVMIATGAHHTLTVDEHGHVWSCGFGRHGQLGHGVLTYAMRIRRIAALVRRRIVTVAAGAAHSLALASDGSVFSWGLGQHGQLGHARLQTAAEQANGDMVAFGKPERLSDLSPENRSLTDRVTSIAAGAHHSLAVTVGGVLLAFGRNKAGCLGLGDEDVRWTPAEVPPFGNGKSASSDSGGKSASGDSGGKSASGGSKHRVVQVAAGGTHSVALVETQGRLGVFAAGSNYFGQLGLGDTDNRSVFTRVDRLANKRIVSVSAGKDNAAAVDRDGRLYVWGRGELGQLGLGDFRSHRTPRLLQGFRVVDPDVTLRLPRPDAARIAAARR